jgi:Cu(I)/Ag(I) efflux system membrane fusion protein
VALTAALLLSACGETGSVASPTEPLAATIDDSAMEHALKHQDPKYVCPMHAQIVRDEPGTCPICGMNLVARQIDTGDSGRPEVSISGEIMQSMGLRTGRVERGTLWRYIRTVGRIDYDETRRAHLHPRADGWIERLYLRAEGDPVEEGAKLGDFYSPDILRAQVDFLVALDQAGGGKRAVRVDQARNRLRLLGVPEATIRGIEKRGETQNTVPLLAPRSGVVTMLGARDGMYVTANKEVVTIADLSQVWVLVDVFEHQIDWLQVGSAAEIEVPAFPGRQWSGKVDYIYPELDPRTRTLRVRLAFDNPDHRLRPNMFAEVSIFGGPKRDVLIVPRAALIETGERQSVVKVLGEGRFQPVDVVPGMRRGDSVEVLSGLAEGDEVVISGQFLIDSESSLQASFMRLSESNASSAHTGSRADTEPGAPGGPER